MKFCRLKILLAVFVFSPLASAEYVSDRLFLGLYDQPDSTANPTNKLDSGTQLKVLQTQGDFVQVQLKDGSTGWARAEFVTTETPAKTLLAQVTADRDKLRNQLRRLGNEQETIKQLQADLKAARQNIVALNEQIKDSRLEAVPEETESEDEQAEIADLQSKLTEAEEQKRLLQQEMELLIEGGATKKQPGENVLEKIGLILISMTACLGIGILLGIRWLSGKIRQRFNGLKVW